MKSTSYTCHFFKLKYQMFLVVLLFFKTKYCCPRSSS